MYLNEDEQNAGNNRSFGPVLEGSQLPESFNIEAKVSDKGGSNTATCYEHLGRTFSKVWGLTCVAQSLFTMEQTSDKN